MAGALPFILLGSILFIMGSRGLPFPLPKGNGSDLPKFILSSTDKELRGINGGGNVININIAGDVILGARGGRPSGGESDEGHLGQGLLPGPRGPVALAVLHSGVVDSLALGPGAYPLPSLRPLPVKLIDAAGGAVQDGAVPIVCGGYLPVHNGHLTPFDSCYRYSTSTKRWTRAGWMSSGKRSLATSVHPEFGLVITGGHSASKLLRTVESTKDGKNFDRSLPDLPVANHAHCQVTVDERTIMVFGGHSELSSTSRTALKLDTVDKKWTELPNLPTGRNCIGCGVVAENGVSKQVVVVGGHNGQHLDTVEILDLATLTWSTGKPYPLKQTYCPGVVQVGDTFVVLGGHGKTRATDAIYRYEPRSGGWTLLPERLPIPQHVFPAFSIKKEAFKH